MQRACTDWTSKVTETVLTGGAHGVQNRYIVAAGGVGCVLSGFWRRGAARVTFRRVPCRLAWRSCATVARNVAVVAFGWRLVASVRGCWCCRWRPGAVESGRGSGVLVAFPSQPKKIKASL